MGNQQLIISNESGTIMNITSSSSIDFDAYPEGVCYVQNLSYASTITGLSVGNSINLLEGCYDLSNSVRISKIRAEVGSITSSLGASINICIDDEMDLVEFVVTGSYGSGFSWI